MQGIVEIEAIISSYSHHFSSKRMSDDIFQLSLTTPLLYTLHCETKTNIL